MLSVQVGRFALALGFGLGHECIKDRSRIDIALREQQDLSFIAFIFHEVSQELEEIDKGNRRMAEPCDLTATEARRLIGQGKLSPVDLVESCIARIEAVNPSVNAVVTKAYDRARSEAKEAAAKVSRGEPLALLHGLPVLIKDINDTEGIRTTYCSPLFTDNVPTADDPIVTRIRAAGGIVLGKTNTPEFATGSNTTNRVFGPTCNPFDTNLTSGGSSGGAGASLATYMAPLASGSDSAASIRNPAAYCGVVGIRSTPGVVASHTRKMGLSNNGVEGPMARTVADLALFFAVLAQPDPRDLLSKPLERVISPTLGHVDVSSLRVGFSEDLGFARVDETVRRTFHKKIATIEPCFASCSKSSVNLTGAEEAYWGVRGLHLLATHHEKYLKHGSDLDVNLFSNLEDAIKRSTADSAKALAEQTRLHQVFQQVFDEYDILITPATNVLPFPHAKNHPTTVQSQPARHYLEWCSILYGISLVGHPAVSLPAGLDEQGTPFGLQIVGPRYADHRLLEIALALETLFMGIEEVKRPEPDLKTLGKTS